jgi:hypothetical protein
MYNLGDKVKDKITGYEGIITGITNWINGCTTCCVKSQDLKDGLPKEGQWLDEPQLKLVKKSVVNAGKDPGGSMPIPKRNIAGRR